MQRAVSVASVVYNYLAFAVGGTGRGIINFRRRGSWDDSPRVKCPIETTAQCVYFLRLSIWRHYSSFSACACQPHYLQTQKKCRCSGNFSQWFIRPSRNIYTLLLLFNLNETNWSGCVKDIIIHYGRYGRCKYYYSLKVQCFICCWNIFISSQIDLRLWTSEILPTEFHQLKHIVMWAVAACQKNATKYEFIINKLTKWQFLIFYINKVLFNNSFN